MRYAVVSDLHANLHAWKAVLLDIRSLDVDRIICLGDIVGYGPHPAEVLASVHTHVDHLVLGNHDAVICGKMDSALFNDQAQDIIRWTQTRLSTDAVRFLQTLPLSLDGGTFRCAHGEFSEPAAFNYIIDPEDAVPSWQAVSAPLLFVGHTHQPSIFLLGHSGIPRHVPPQDFLLEPEKRFLVNVGSVGQPRDGETRACYCLYDTEAASVCWRRIPFDIDAYRNAVEQTGLPVAASYFLKHDPRATVPPIRELLNFSPPTTPDQTVQNTVEVADLTVLRRRVATWKLASAAALSLGLAAAALLTSLLWRHHARAQDLPPQPLPQASALTHALGQNLLQLPSRASEPGVEVPGWSIHLGNRYRQQVQVVLGAEGEPELALSSDTSRDPLHLSSAPVRVAPDTRFCVEARFRKSDDFRGNIDLRLCVTKRTEDGTIVTESPIIKQPTWDRGNGWYMAKETCHNSLPDNVDTIRAQIHGQFTGQVHIRAISLSRKE